MKGESTPPLPRRNPPSRNVPPPPLHRVSSEEKPPRPPPPIKPRPIRKSESESELRPRSKGIDEPAPSFNDDPMDDPSIYISPTHLNENHLSDACMVTVTKFDRGLNEAQLKQYFEDRTQSGGGPVISVSIIDGAALVRFEDEEDAERVLRNEQQIGGRRVSVMPSPLAKEKTNNEFFITGISDHVSLGRVQEFMETITKCPVTKIRPHEVECSVVVTFSEDNYPEFLILQSLCRQYPLEGCVLEVCRYREDGSGYMSMDALLERDIPMTTGQIKYIERFLMDRLKAEVDRVEATFKFESNWSRMVVKGKREILADLVAFVQELVLGIHEHELPIHMAGIVALLKEKTSKDNLAEIEKAENCVIDVQEGTYAIINSSDKERKSYLDSDNDSSGGSVKSHVTRQRTLSTSSGYHADEETRPHTPTGGPRLQEIESRKELRGEFQIGSCRFVLKSGQVLTEDTDCVVNITYGPDLEKGDIWNSLEPETQLEVRRQAGLAPYRSEWKGHGMLVTPVSRQPFQLILHINQKHLKGDLFKTAVKCLQVTLSRRLESIAFFSMWSKGKRDSSLEESPQLIVDAINKFQKAEKPRLYTVRLVLEKVDQQVIKQVTEEVISLKDQRKKGLFTHGRSRPKSPKDKQIRILSPSFSMNDASYDSHTDCSDSERKGEGEGVLSRYHLTDADITVYIYSASDPSNRAAVDKLWDFCQRAMPPVHVKDDRIKRLSTSDIKQLRSNKVEVHLEAENGHIEMRGFPPDVERKRSKLAKILDKIESPPEIPSSTATTTPKEEDTQQDDLYVNKEVISGFKVRPLSSSSLTEDDDEIFGKFIASELRGFPDDRDKKKLKHEIKKLLMDAQVKYL